MEIFKNWKLIKRELANDKTINSETYNRYILTTEVYSHEAENIHSLIFVSKNQFYTKLLKAMKQKIALYVKKTDKKNNDYTFYFLTTSQFKCSNFFKQLLKHEEKIRTKLLNSHKNFQQKQKIFKTEVKNKKPKINGSVERASSIFDKTKKQNFTFENFCVGPSNKQAFLALNNSVDNFLQKKVNMISATNPIFLWSQPGLGKTHLLYATFQKLKQKTPQKKIIFIESDQLTSLFLNQINSSKINQKKITEFKNQILAYDVFILDDIQLMKKRTKTNEFLFQILNYFLNHNKLFILSSDTHPSRFLKNDFEKRLISRLRYGLNITIKKPLLNTSIAIIKKNLKRSNFSQKVSSDVVTYIAQNYSNDIRDMEGIISRLIFMSMLYSGHSNELKKEISLDTVKKWLVDNPPNVEISDSDQIDRIKKIVSEELKIPVELLESTRRQKKIMLARQISIFLAHKKTRASIKTLSLNFGNRVHTTITYAIKIMNQKIKNDPVFKKLIQKVETIYETTK